MHGKYECAPLFCITDYVLWIMNEILFVVSCENEAKTFIMYAMMQWWYDAIAICHLVNKICNMR